MSYGRRIDLRNLGAVSIASEISESGRKRFSRTPGYRVLNALSAFTVVRLPLQTAVLEEVR
jgi:hypothetical protein